MAIYWNQVFNSALALCPPSEFLSVIKYNLWFHYEQITKLAQLEYKGFTEELSSFLSSFPFFTEIDDLYSVKQRPGIYLLVLDDYACCYFGQSKDIKQRIMQHWRKTNFSTTGIDMFKALDTTRIYVLCTEKDVTQSLIDRVEYHVIHAIDRRYLLKLLWRWQQLGAHSFGFTWPWLWQRSRISKKQVWRHNYEKTTLFNQCCIGFTVVRNNQYFCSCRKYRIRPFK